MSPERIGARAPTGAPGGRQAKPLDAARLEVLNAVAAEILSNLDLDATLQSVTNAARQQVGAELVGIMLWDEDQDVLRFQALSGHRDLRGSQGEVHRGEAVAGSVFETGALRRVDDLLTDTTIPPRIREYAMAEDARSALGAPMMIGSRVIGVLMAWSRHPCAFDAHDEEILTNLASMATIAIENARLFERERGAVRALEAQCEILERSSNLHEELTGLVLSGGGLSDVADTVARYTAGTAAIVGPDLELLAATPEAESVVAAARSYLRSARPRGDTPPRTVVVPSDASEGPLLIREVTAGLDRLGYLCVALQHPPGSLEPIVVEQAAVVCALDLTKQQAVLEARTRVRTDFVRDLLEGHVADEAEALIRARHLGCPLPASLRVMLIGVDGLADWARAAGTDANAVGRRREALVRAAEDQASEAGVHNVLVARRGSSIALILPGGEDIAKTRRVAGSVINGLADANPELRFAGGLSAISSSTADLRQAAFQAQSALASASAETSPVALFDDLGVLRFLLAPGDRKELLAFARSVLGPAMEYDDEHSAEFISTIEAYLAEDCSLRQTAAHLHLHPKSVHYRLTRFRELSGRDLASQKDRFETQLALLILRSLGLNETPSANP